jgi:hypothetical protein
VAPGKALVGHQGRNQGCDTKQAAALPALPLTGSLQWRQLQGGLRGWGRGSLAPVPNPRWSLGGHTVGEEVKKEVAPTQGKDSQHLKLNRAAFRLSRSGVSSLSCLAKGSGE